MTTLIQEPASWNGRSFMLTWRPNFTPPVDASITQASGICFTSEGEIVLVEDKNTGERMLPGGHPEAGETLKQTLSREVFEEACAVVEQAVYLGVQGVDDGVQSHYQARFWARVKLEPFEPHFETSRRLLIKPADFINTLNWSTKRLARAMFSAALDIEEHSRQAR